MRLALALTLLSIAGSSSANLTDTLIGKQWGVKNIGQDVLSRDGNLTREHKKGVPGVDIRYTDLNKLIAKDKQAKEVIVAVIDSGLDIKHPDLEGRIWFNKERCTNGEGEEKHLPCYGWNFADNNADLSDGIGHGTHVSGIIAANRNSIGIAGVAHENVKIMPLKVINKSVNDFVYKGRMVTDIFADAIRFAVENGAQVINMSLGWPKLVETPKIRTAIDIALSKNIAIVVATGNNGKDIPTYPCSYEGVICVGAHDNQGSISQFSNHGGKVDLLAPGEFIVSTYPTGIESRSLRIQGYEAKKGSSQASPFVTAAVANLMVSNPGITNNEIQARLFNSAIKDNEAYDRFSLFGRLNYSEALRVAPKTFIAPMFKNLLDIKMFPNKEILIPVTIKNYLADQENIEIEVSLNNNNIKLKKSVYKVSSLSSGKMRKLNVPATIINTAKDSHVKLSVTVKVAGDSRTYSTAIVINRQLDIRTAAATAPFKDVTLTDIAYFDRKTGRKFNFLRRVIDKHGNSTYPEFYFTPRKLKTVHMLQNNGSSIAPKKLPIDPKDQVVFILKKDFNFDGKTDYMVYTKGAESENLYFYFLDQNLKPLYGKHSKWTFPISLFGGLPEQGDKEVFHWSAFKSKKLGKILVPVIFKAWDMPEEDNGDDIIDNIVGQAPHLYYLRPTIKKSSVEVSIRVLDTFDFYQELREEFSLFGAEEISISAPFTQTNNDIAKGRITFNLAIGHEFDKEYYTFSMTGPGNWQRVSHGYVASQIDGNSSYPTFNLDKRMSFNPNMQFMVLYDRTHGRVSEFSPKKGEVKSLEVKTGSWGDPIFNYIAGFKGNGQNISFIESRYSVQVLGQGKVLGKLPINRDSSFTGVNFSETLAPITVKGADQMSAGIYIDSTVVYGDRIYTMLWDGHDFTRPIELSFIIPKTCVDLNPVRWGESGEFHYALVCLNKKTKSMELKVFPLELK